MVRSAEGRICETQMIKFGETLTVAASELHVSYHERVPCQEPTSVFNPDVRNECKRAKDS